MGEYCIPRIKMEIHGCDSKRIERSINGTGFIICVQKNRVFCKKISNMRTSYCNRKLWCLIVILALGMCVEVLERKGELKSV